MPDPIHTQSPLSTRPDDTRRGGDGFRGQFIRDSVGLIVAEVFDSALHPGRRQADAERLVRVWNCHDELVAACEAALTYDAAIQRVAAQHGTPWVDSKECKDDLDALYEGWIAKAIAAVEKAKGG